MTLPQLRGQLVDALQAGGVPAVRGEPARISPPVALVAPGSPYLAADGLTFGRLGVRLRVRLVVPAGDTALDELDELIEAAVPAIEGAGEADTADVSAGWTVLAVSEPYSLVVGTVAFPAVDLTVTTSAEI